MPKKTALRLLVALIVVCGANVQADDADAPAVLDVPTTEPMVPAVKSKDVCDCHGVTCRGCRSRRCGACNSCCGGVCGGVYGACGGMCSGQPLIDPYAHADWLAQQRAAAQSWHAGYYHTQWGAPLALVVPPHARMQTRMGWGVSQTTVAPIYHQFKRPYPGPVTGMAGDGTIMPLQPTPRWPSHTDQFGVYYIRSPW